ncbi:hypothetical protein BLNAU_20083 [Blattamonas nauphoetae]|uniref:ZP domain-containing protein n=1 Tax=Blattamonas nauphoetae TaxID=2049346 RepID=A0ABQ9WZQ1_9EUKA|nr:hypothetical protein BLNAU_20083 [Blattamonas nauphoetae]
MLTDIHYRTVIARPTFGSPLSSSCRFYSASRHALGCRQPDQDTQKEVGQHPLTARVDTSSQIRVNCTMETLVVTNEALTRAKLITGCKDDTRDNGRFSCGYRRSAYVPLEYGIPKCLTVQCQLYVDETKTDTAGCGSRSTP